ncbi:MAG TPA: phage major capsid protein, partial [Mycobacterium sp.]|nr:phage major capsid protein [Mycobacterium sp.]
MLTCATKGGEVEGDAPAVRVGYVDDDDATVVAEGNPIPEGEPELAERLCYTSKVAQLVRISRERWVQDQTAEQLSQSVSRAITNKADDLFLNAPNPSPNVAPAVGVLNAPGVIVGGTVTADLDALIDLIAELQSNDSI